MGVAAAGVSPREVGLTGLAGLVAGAMSMAAGEFVSVSAQADTEAADLARERIELTTQVESERAELAGIYQARGLEPELARQVALQLMAHDALGAHARDELGLTEGQRSRPAQAALASALTFAVGAAVPLLTVLLAPASTLSAAVPALSLVSLALLGALSARVGGAPVSLAALRVACWGALAMAATYGVGRLFNSQGL